jgi:hypothetical protein
MALIAGKKYGTLTWRKIIMKKNNRSLILLGILCACILSWCLIRDLRIEKQYGSDLRNRVVGARLQMDGKLPYFYYWRPEHGGRYYDPFQKDTTYANAITASPFFHHLLYPIANLPQRQISRIWLTVEYSLFIACMLIAFSFTKNGWQRWAVAVSGMLFLFTTAWVEHIHVNQIYIFFPLLCLAFIYFFRRPHNLFFSFFAGLTAVSLVLARPTMIFFFIPFLLLINRYSLKYLLVFFTPVIILLSYSFFNKMERSFWIDYKKGLAAQIEDHQSGTYGLRNLAFKQIRYAEWEGWNQDSIRKEKELRPIKFKIEFAGVKSIAINVFNKKLSTKELTYSFGIISVFLITFFVIKRWKDPSMNVAIAAIFGFCLYMLSDLFSPIVRPQYNTVQWLFPLLFCASFYDRRYKKFHLLLTLGLVLNVLTISQIKMRHTLGEYLILFALLWFSFFYKPINEPVAVANTNPST